MIMLIVACTPAATPQPLPAGDAARGAILFTQPIDGTPLCTGCHTLDGSPLSGPSLKGYGAVAGTRITGMSASDYTVQSLVNPASFLVSSYGNLMYNQYGQHLSGQQIADLVAFLLTQ